MTPASQPLSSETASQFLSVLAVLSASGAVLLLLFPNPLADIFFAGIVTLSVIFAGVGGIGAWTNRTPLVWGGALLLTGLSLIGMMSIGFLLAPAALFLLGAAVCSQLAGPRMDVREAILADPPTTQEIAWKTLLGISSVIGGLGLVYAGAITQELFGSCARETLACALETTNWSGVGLTLLGLFAVSYGGWLLWKQSYLTRVRASTQTR